MRVTGSGEVSLVANVSLGLLLVTLERQIPLYPDRSFQVTSLRVPRNQQEATLFRTTNVTCKHKGPLVMKPKDDGVDGGG